MVNTENNDEENTKKEILKPKKDNSLFTISEKNPALNLVQPFSTAHLKKKNDPLSTSEKNKNKIKILKIIG